MELRYYQRDAIDSIYKYFEANDGNPGIVLPTGTGKSMVIAKFIEEALAAWPDTRILVSTHVKELVGQNYAEFVNLCPFAPVGIYSAGLNRRDKSAQILFCGIQSVYNKAYTIQRCDLLIIDEAHTVPKDGEGMWRTFIDELIKINPQMKIIWLTATDYRMDSGLLTTGENAIFTDVCYEYGLLQAIRDGYLCPVVPTSMATRYELDGVRTLGGDYKRDELEAAMDIDALTMKAIDEIESYGVDRRSWLIFAAGNTHAGHIHTELARRGYKGAVVTQSTDKGARGKAVDDIRNGNIRYLVNNRIFTTGFNAKNIDMIADLAPTKSAGLHVQKLGRGTRCLGANIEESIINGKGDCLLLDFARNVDYHGPLDQIRGRDKSKGDGDAPVKVCPGIMDNGNPCAQVLFAGIRKCFHCGHEFEMGGLDIRADGGDAPILSSQIPPEWHDVIGVSYALHENRKDKTKPPTLRVTYTCYSGTFNEFICLQHTGYARDKAVSWWKRNADISLASSAKQGAEFIAMGVPNKIETAMQYKHMIKKPSKILVEPDGKYWKIIGRDFDIVENNDVYEEIKF